jgi:Domain of unknown function (DUF4177)
MQRWEYRVVTLREGHYTEKLNEYGSEGWELVDVAADVRSVAAAEASAGGTLPMPRAFGRLEDAASKLSKLGGEADPQEVLPLTTWTTLVWVLRRPLHEDYE